MLFDSLCPLCVLCASVVNGNFNHNQFAKLRPLGTIALVKVRTVEGTNQHPLGKFDGFPQPLTNDARQSHPLLITR